MPLLIGICFSTGGIISFDLETEEFSEYQIKEVNIDDNNLKKKLNEAMSYFVEDEIEHTSFIIPPNWKTESCSLLSKFAFELDIGKFDFISYETACYMTVISKYRKMFRDNEVITIIIKAAPSELMSSLCRNYTDQIELVEKLNFAFTKSKLKKLKKQLKKFKTSIIFDSNIELKNISPLFDDLIYYIMEPSQTFWHLRGVLEFKNGYSFGCPQNEIKDYIGVRYKIICNGETLYEIDNPILPFKKILSIEFETCENQIFEVYKDGIEIDVLKVAEMKKTEIEVNIDIYGNVIMNKVPWNVNSETNKNNNFTEFLKFKQLDRNIYQPNSISTFECLVCFGKHQFVDGYFKCCNWAKGNPKNSHAICKDCLEGHAKATIYEFPIVPEADGIRCVDPDCKNIFLLANIWKHLSTETSEALLNRFQRENLLIASKAEKLGILYQCEKCGYQGLIDKTHPTYICACGLEICGDCLKPFDESHIGKTCEEVKEAIKKEKIERNVEEQISECIIRKCPNCKQPFVKSDGCNKMTCPCGMNSCYLCNAPNIDYDHFCGCHEDDENMKEYICLICNKTCRLFEDAEASDQERIRDVLGNLYKTPQKT